MLMENERLLLGRSSMNGMGMAGLGWVELCSRAWKLLACVGLDTRLKQIPTYAYVALSGTSVRNMVGKVADSLLVFRLSCPPKFLQDW